MGNKKCLLIGGGGFLGCHLVRSMLANDIPVKVFDRNTSKVQRFFGGASNLEILEGDIYSSKELIEAVQGVSDVIYLAHTTVPSTSMENIVFDIESNLPALVATLEPFSKNESIQRFIYFSSGGVVYGDVDPRVPIHENQPLFPISSYGITKMVSEHYVRLCLSRSTLTSYIIRPANAYGEWQNLKKPQGIVGHFLKSLIYDQDVVLFGDGSIVRDYVYGSDVADAARLCIQDKTGVAGETYFFNVGSSQGVSSGDLINIMEDVTGRKFRIKRLPDRKFDCRYNVLDYSAIHEKFGWAPKVALREGIERTWEAFQKELADDGVKVA